MSAALRLWWRLRRTSYGIGHDAGGGRGVDALAVVAYAVASAALLITLGGVHAFVTRDAQSPSEASSLYVALALIAAGLLVVPILTLGAVAARLSLGRRDARLATLRLSGATSGQVSLMVLAESVVQALVGAVAGTAAYGLAIPALTRVAFEGRPLTAAHLWLGVPAILAVVGVVVVLAIASGLSSLAGVAIGPLGVARRTTPGRLRIWRLAVGAMLILAWVFGAQLLGRLGVAATLAVLVALVAAVNLAGPFVVQLAGRFYARRATSAAGLVAARRIVDDPRATWRSVSALGLAICLAALSCVGGSDQPDPQGSTMATDLGTGALIALVIVSAVAATATGVVQAARVIDQRATYRDLALAGTPLRVLHRARLLEVAVPLLVTLVMGATLPLLILLPMSSLLGVGVLVRTAVALALSVLALLGSVYLSRGLVRRYAAAASPASAA